MKALFVNVLFLSSILCSCIFSPDNENFLEIDQDATPPEITNQTLDLDIDTLYVWKYTRFNFDLKSNAQQISSVVVTYGDHKLTFQSGKGSFDVNPHTYPEGTSRVEIKVYTNSGTGSLADAIGAEGYELKNEWVLIVEKPKDPEIHLTSSIENGFLKFSWNKFDKPNFHSYRLVIQNDGIFETYYREYTDENITSFVDSLFVGGKITLSLGVNYYDVNEFQNRASKEYSYEFPVAISFKEDLENLTISWNRNPFQCTKYLDINGSGQTKINADTSYTIPAPGLGGGKRYHLAFKPIKPLYSNRMNDHYVLFANGVNNSMSHKTVEYNQGLKTYFFKEEMHLRASGQDIAQEASYDYPWDYNDRFTLDVSKDNQRVFSTVGQNLVQLNTKGMGLISSTKLPMAAQEDITSWVLKNLAEDVFIIGYNLDFGSYFTLFNAKTNSIIATSNKLAGEYISAGNYVYAISPDGKYAAYCGSKGLILYEIIDNQQLVLHYQDSNTYYSCFFDPTNPEMLVLNRPTNYQVFNCSTLKVEKTNNQFYANPINIDPLTHYMLLVSNAKKKIYVYDMENDVVKLEMNHHGSAFDFKLLNNNIFVSSGYHFDISSYVD